MSTWRPTATWSSRSCTHGVRDLRWVIDVIEAKWLRTTATQCTSVPQWVKWIGEVAGELGQLCAVALEYVDLFHREVQPRMQDSVGVDAGFHSEKNEAKLVNGFQVQRSL